MSPFDASVAPGPEPDWLRRHLPEQVQLQALLEQGARHLRARTLTQIPVRGRLLPILCVEAGSRAARAPVLVITAGIHGIERIGSQVVLSWLHSLVHRLDWDDGWNRLLERVRILVVPLANPGGIALRTRANPAGVDLMRNAPVDADERPPWLVGGHRLGRWLPWYRGPRQGPMEPEAEALCQLVRGTWQQAPAVLVLDCHSGFGRVDRIWCGYAGSRQSIPSLPEFFSLVSLYQRTWPHHHPYVFEPQCLNYTTHGDLWDYLLHRHAQAPLPHQWFLPLTLEMGSWLWLRKNPRQMLDRFGLFHPLVQHRHQRVLRQHLPWLDFLVSALAHQASWVPLPHQRDALARQAREHWYPPALR